MKKGFTIIELMIVIAIIAFLSMVAVPTFSKFMAKAKRAEAYMNLSSIYAAQKAYWAEHGKYSDVLNGDGGIGWQPEGNINYTYGFIGSAGRNNFVGKLNTPMSGIGNPHADQQGFVVVAIGDIDGDGNPDVLTVDQNNNIVVVQDDLN